MPDRTERPILHTHPGPSVPGNTIMPNLRKKGCPSCMELKSSISTYLYGHKFILFTDHKPMVKIFCSKKGLPSLAAARLQRSVILLSRYQYKIWFKQHSDSKWPEVFKVTTTSSSKTIIIELCRQLFASYGLPRQIFTDNGPQFVSDKFRSFLKHHVIKHLQSAPYHPSTDGEADQTFKNAMWAGIGEALSLQHITLSFICTCYYKEIS